MFEEKKRFVKIQSFFNEKEERNLMNLSKIYSANDLLIHKIDDLLGESFLNKLKGKKILINPNWVLHSQNPDDDICLRTHNSILLSTLEIILNHNPRRVVIGDAPINVCDWDKMIDKGFTDTISNLSTKFNVKIDIKDFRRFTFNTDKNVVAKDIHPLKDYVIFNVAEKSYLESISKPINSGFRVTNYDPDRLSESHKLGTHKYCITKELFDADIVLSMPKIKTHQKTGITAALKNLVGLNGDKDFLPHHRVGGTGFGGDCYPGKNILRRSSEYFLDCANRRMGKKLYRVCRFFHDGFWRISSPEKVHQIAAGWYGNDTCWRMVMDLNLIAEFGSKDGVLKNIPQREIYSLCDGIIAGQGNGPLTPDPLPLGILTFTNNSSLHDVCIAHLMGFNPDNILLLKNAQKKINMNERTVIFDNNEIKIDKLVNFKIKTIPPPGWEGHI